jgi:hypothetical protein
VAVLSSKLRPGVFVVVLATTLAATALFGGGGGVIAGYNDGGRVVSDGGLSDEAGLEEFADEGMKGGARIFLGDGGGSEGLSTTGGNEGEVNDLLGDFGGDKGGETLNCISRGLGRGISIVLFLSSSSSSSKSPGSE